MGETAVLRSDDPRVPALAAAGWRTTARSFGAQLDVRDLDEERLRARRDRVAPLVVRELRDADLPAVRALDAATVRDYPGGAATRHAALTDATAALHHARRAFGALTPDGRLLGLTYLDRDADAVETDFTVVDAAFRGRGIGVAVKAASVLALAHDGVRRFRTGGSADNAAIIAAGIALGYRRDEEWVTLER